MSVVRYVLAGLIVLAGVVVLVARGFDVAALDAVVMVIAAGSSVFLLNWLSRIGASGDTVRDDEEAAGRTSTSTAPGLDRRRCGARPRGG